MVLSKIITGFISFHDATINFKILTLLSYLNLSCKLFANDHFYVLPIKNYFKTFIFIETKFFINTLKVCLLHGVEVVFLLGGRRADHVSSLQLQEETIIMREDYLFHYAVVFYHFEQLYDIEVTAQLIFPFV